ncbi:CHAT domain-containing protein [Nodularia sp. LEGE 04288]|uniref:CHAT domain-containing protein n=1 Tax=Nodularia sp. LEGE 04288 TaxID=1828639 RepID=UPI001D11233E|nr:CHAT domain-containing protein [Nodularia sp. LEGE 04288]MCC2695758.1 CHAT domain-containing protein [Nodularia sp. LEGE 04288]
MNKYKKNKSKKLIQELVNLELSEYKKHRNKLKEGIILYRDNPNTPKKALHIIRQAIKLCEKIDKSNIDSIFLFEIGCGYTILGEHRKAIDYLQDYLIIAIKTDNHDMQARACHFLSESYRSLGEFNKAIKHEQHFLRISKDYKYLEGEATSLNNLGKDNNSLGLYELAIDYLQESLTIAQENGYQKCESAALSNLGDAYYYLGKLQKAIDYYQQSLIIEERIGNRRGEAFSLGALGNVYEDLGEYEEAIIRYEKFFKITQDIRDEKGKLNALLGLGNTFSTFGDYNKAVNYYHESLEIAQKIKDNQGEADSLVGIGNFYVNCGEYRLAIDFYQQYLMITQKINDRKGELIALCNLGTTYSLLEEFKLAITYFQKSIAIAKKNGNSIEQGKIFNNLGVIFFRINQLTKAQKVLYNAIHIWESVRLDLVIDTHKISIFETQSFTYLILQEVLVSQHKILEALEISERGRTRAFVELLAKRLAAKPLDSIQKLHLKEAINPPSIDTIRHITELHKSTIVEYSIIYRENLYTLYIWVITPIGEITFRQVDLQPLLEDGTSLEEILEEARSRIANNSWPNDAQPFAHQLYQDLIQPIYDLLPTEPNQPVIFIPHKQLFLIPFPALQNKANGKFLIEDHTILTVPSIMTLNLTHQQRERLQNGDLEVREDFIDALVVGNPTMPIDPDSQLPTPFKPLPYAEEEAKEIASLLNTEALIGNKALKSDILQQMPKARLIHFATHGLLNINKLVVPGAIALAPSGDDSGLLTSSEILDLDLNAELVVLSACDTGRGIINSDGVIGLSRCLFLAGVPSVILSLWEVQDSSTKVLMIEFYRNLHRGMNKAQALRQAMLITMQQYRNCPNMWAAFTLIGEAE